VPVVLTFASRATVLKDDNKVQLERFGNETLYTTVKGKKESIL
jgi:hypothetical protein